MIVDTTASWPIPAKDVRLPLVQYLSTVDTAAHLTDHVFPRLPVRQWLLSVPKRLRYFTRRDGMVRKIVLRC